MIDLVLKPKALFTLLILVSGFLLFFNLGKGSLWDWDEAIYASVAKEMVRDGDYLSPHLNRNYWPEKPPLVIWGIAAAFRIFGVNEFSARLPIAIFGLLNVMLIYFIASRFFNHWIGLLSAMFLISCLHFLISARMAMLDVPLAFFISAALCFYWLGREKPVFYIYTGVMIGLAVMTKSLIGFFPFLIIALHLLLTSQRPAKQPLFWTMLPIALLIAAPWHIHQILVQGKPFVDYYFTYNLFKRFTSVLDTHSGTMFFYIKYVFEHFFTPWLCLSFAVLLGFGPAALRRFRENKSDPTYFALIWFLTPFLFFALAKTKSAGYIIPCYFPLAIITAKLSLDNLYRPWFKKVFFLFLAITAAEIVLFHPLKMIEINKSPEIKQIAAMVRVDNRRLVTLNIPPNAPTFYFNSSGVTMSDAAQLGKELAQLNGLFILCKKQDVPKIADCIMKYNLKIRAVSQNGNVLLMSAS